MTNQSIYSATHFSVSTRTKLEGYQAGLDWIRKANHTDQAIFAKLKFLTRCTSPFTQGYKQAICQHYAKGTSKARFTLLANQAQRVVHIREAGYY